MYRKSAKGFTLVEMLVVITIIGILAAMAVPNFVKARDKAKEGQARNHLHIIQTEIERYYTDFGQYPPYIAGGNFAAWTVFNSKAKAVDPDLEFLIDPLIEKGYIKSYPRNVFWDEDAGINVHKATDFGITGDPDNPMGDPRFGDQGVTMANVMDDPRFWDAARNPAEPELRFYNSRGAPTGTKPWYAFGGFERNGNPIQNFWSGQFIYRAVGDIDLQQTSLPEGPANLWDFRCGMYEHYVMGVYGSQQSKGLDVIRLTGQGNYYDDPDDNFNYTVPLALPEVMGGGGTPDQPMPAFPYRAANEEEGTLRPGEWTFGAPDGYPDGIVMIFSSSGWKMTRK